MLNPYNPTLVWLDLETGGLNGVQSHNGFEVLGETFYPILQVSVILTDLDLNQIAGPLTLNVHLTPADLDKLSPWAKETHEASGLVEACRYSTLSLAEVEDEILNFLDLHGVKPWDSTTQTGGILAGSSIHFDRSFIKRRMLKLDKYVHFRMLDVSSLRILAKFYRPDLLVEDQKTFAHTAESDIRETIMELDSYLRLYRMPVEGTA